MAESARKSVLKGIVRRLCPRCRKGAIFSSSILRIFPAMHPYCPECGLKFEREPGYFLGAMYISYGLALVTIATLSACLWLIAHWSFTRVIVVAIVLFLPLVPPITVLSRVLWIYLDQTVDPDRE